MFKSILLICLFSLIGSVKEGKIRTIEKEGYTVVYDEVKRQPVKVTYRVICNRTLYSRKGLDFEEEAGVITSGDEDYTNNEWDKGHMAPAADFSCNEELLRQTFSYVNCALQHEKLNRGVWKKLETRERELSKRYVVNIIISVHFSGSSRRLKSGAVIPDAFTKTISYGREEERFYFRNEEPKSRNIDDYILR